MVHVVLTVGTNILDPMQSSILKYCARKNYIRPRELNNSCMVQYLDMGKTQEMPVRAQRPFLQGKNVEKCKYSLDCSLRVHHP